MRIITTEENFYRCLTPCNVDPDHQLALLSKPPFSFDESSVMSGDSAAMDLPDPMHCSDRTDLPSVNEGGLSKSTAPTNNSPPPSYRPPEAI